ncbi:TPA: hypothetical protein QCX06_002103 [Bacillus paranthracis]|nr:hypothetical protein [Bacillus paranthracis]HDR7304501.1 hypothetical protein [Bacillus paranthracis]
MVNFHGLGMPSFDFGGVNSLNTYNLRLTAKPTIPTPYKRAEESVVGGRDSVLTFTDGTYENIKIEVPVRTRVLEREAGAHFQRVSNWLMSKQFENRELQFSHFTNWVFEVYRVSPYTWEYFPATGEYSTTLTFECRPYKKSSTEDIISIESGGANLMSPWFTFKASDRDQFNKNLFEVGDWEVMDGDNYDLSMMYNSGLIYGEQNGNNKLADLDSVDGKGLSLDNYPESDVMASHNFLYSFLDKTSNVNGEGGRWYYSDPKVKPMSGKGISVGANGGLMVARATYSQATIRTMTNATSANANPLYVNYTTSTPSNVSISVYEVHPTTYTRIRTLLASGKDGAMFTLMPIADDSKIQVSIEFSSPLNDVFIDNVRITRTQQAPYSTTFGAYSAFNVKANIIEMAKKIDQYTFNNADSDSTKLKAIMDRNPEIEFTQVDTLQSNPRWLLHDFLMFYEYGSNTKFYNYGTDVTQGTKTWQINPLKRPDTGAPIPLNQAVGSDSKMHFITRTGVSRTSGAIGAKGTAMLDQLQMRMRMTVPPSLTREYDNRDGEKAPMRIELTLTGNSAIISTRNVSQVGLYSNFRIAAPSKYHGSTIVIDTSTFLVTDLITGAPLTQYCYGTFPRCDANSIMSYRLSGTASKARIAITKRVL